MEKSKSFKPKGYSSVTPYLTVEGADKCITFLKNAFDAQELSRYETPEKNHIMHAVVKIGDSIIEVSDASPEFPAVQTAVHLYVPDVDAVYKKAIKAGGVSKTEPKDQFYGDRESYVKDPFGNNWYIATHVKDVSEEELKKEMKMQHA